MSFWNHWIMWKDDSYIFQQNKYSLYWVGDIYFQRRISSEWRINVLFSTSIWIHLRFPPCSFSHCVPEKKLAWSKVTVWYVIKVYSMETNRRTRGWHERISVTLNTYKIRYKCSDRHDPLRFTLYHWLFPFFITISRYKTYTENKARLTLHSQTGLIFVSK